MSISWKHKEKTKGAYGSRFWSIHREDREVIVRRGRSLDTLDRRNGMYGNHSGSTSRIHYYSHHHYHPYRKGEYLPEEFKKVKAPTFDGETKKPEDVGEWFLGLKRFFRFHRYKENMKAKVTTFSLKGKADI